MSAGIGGPVGAHARPHRWWVPVRVVLALFALGFALSLVQHQPCLKTSWANDQARYGKMCYSDVPYLYTGRGYAEGLWPYADAGGRYEVTEYPVGISYLAWTAAKLTQLHPSGPPMVSRHLGDPRQLWSLPGMKREVNTDFLVTALLLCLFGLAATWFLAGTHRGRPWDALYFVLSPSLLATGLINWDLMAVAFLTAALWAWSRERSLLAGVLIGLGAATKLYPAFLLGPILVVAWRRRELGRFGLVALGAAVAWVLSNAPAWLSGAARWKVFWSFNEHRGADLGSLWLVFVHGGHRFTSSEINTWSWTLFGAVCVAVALLGLRARETPRVAQLAFLVVAGFLVVNKVYSPQYALWLLPLAVLARPRWRDLLIWQAGELIYLVAVWSYLGGSLQAAVGEGVPAYDAAIWLRVAAQLYLMGMVVRDIVMVEHDPVQAERIPHGVTRRMTRPGSGRSPALS